MCKQLSSQSPWASLVQPEARCMISRQTTAFQFHHLASTSIFAVSSRMSECSQKAVVFATNAKRCIRLALICLRSMRWRQVLAARTSARTTLRERTSPVLTRGMLAHQQPHISTGSRVLLDSDYLC